MAGRSVLMAAAGVACVAVTVAAVTFTVLAMRVMRGTEPELPAIEGLSAPLSADDRARELARLTLEERQRVERILAEGQTRAIWIDPDDLVFAFDMNKGFRLVGLELARLAAQSDLAEDRLCARLQLSDEEKLAVAFHYDQAGRRRLIELEQKLAAGMITPAELAEAHGHDCLRHAVAAYSGQ